MTFNPILIFFSLHAILSIIAMWFILFGKTSLRKEHIIPLVVLPIIGPLMIAIIEVLNISGEQGRKPIEPDSEDLSEDILWKALKSYHEKGNIVPLEEAIMINDVKTRRKFMLETLYDDPLKYLDVLLLAKNNEDVETSHYATTTISHAQKKFQVAIQDLAVTVENDLGNMNLLDKYLETLEKYIDSNLLEEHLLRNMRIVYNEAIDKKLARVKNDKMTLIRKIRNSIDLGDYASAFGASDLLIEYYPKDEQTWIEAVRVCVEGADHNRLLEIIDKIQKAKFVWTKQGKERLSPWLRGALL
jgi:hypothetical protein